MAEDVRAAADAATARAAEAAAADNDEALVSWSPRSLPQAAYITCPVFEIFFGGSRGSLKTESTLGDWLSHADQYGEDAVGFGGSPRAAEVGVHRTGGVERGLHHTPGQFDHILTREAAGRARHRVVEESLVGLVALAEGGREIDSDVDVLAVEVWSGGLGLQREGDAVLRT